MFYCCFFLSFPRGLRAPSADQRETSPHDWKCVQLDNGQPTISEAFFPKIEGEGEKRPKLADISEQSRSRMSPDRIKVSKSDNVVIKSDPSRVGKKLVNFVPLTTQLERWTLTQPKSTFSENHISAHRGCCPIKFLRELEKGQCLL